MAVVASEAERSAELEAGGDGLEFAGARQNTNPLSFSVAGNSGPTVDNGVVSFPQQKPVVLLNLAQQGHQNLHARVNLAALEAQRSGNGTQLVRNFAMIDIDPDTDHHGVKPVRLGVHFGENAAQLLAVQE